MWYVIDNTDDELYHYGVSGMKWGVSRDIKRRSVKAAIAKKLSKIDDKSISKINKSIGKKRKKLRTTEDDVRKRRIKLDIAKKQSELKNTTSNKKMVDTYRSHLIKDMSEKDVKKGERWLIGTSIATTPLYIVPYLGPAVDFGTDSHRYLTVLNEADAYSKSKKNR